MAKAGCDMENVRYSVIFNTDSHVCFYSHLAQAVNAS